MFPKDRRNQIPATEHIDMVTRDIDEMRRCLPDGSASPLTHEHRDWNRVPPSLPKEDAEMGNGNGKGKGNAKKRKTG